MQVRFTVSVAPETLKRIDRLAKLREDTRSELVEELLLQGLDHAELTAAATADPVVMGAFVKAMSEPGVLRSLAASMRADLSDDQLALFSSRLGDLEGSTSKGKRKGKK